ncbi:efflux RND transporter periplasmic adaptor subunit [Acidocella sp.]|uniref:efflux RND transporter periplasmic adaptor subunit n=1 Tax=Acidocella sp. TaxID=50710 RepID=UPI00260FBBE5|nr:efflux RND transporter periplasmic adaptor subunit [Acidocella sp.]
MLLAAFIWWRHSGTTVQHAPAAPSVGVAKAVSGAMPVVLDELGTVTPTATVTVQSQISGYLTKVGFTEGQNVVAGQFLAQIDPRPYQIQLEQYQAAHAKDAAVLGQAESDLARYEKLAAQDSISAQQVADQRFLVQQDTGTLAADQANIDSARLNLSYCDITAPVAGKVGLRLVDAGNYVTPGSTTGIAVITSIAPTTVIFSVAQTDLAPILVRLGQGAQLPAYAYASDDTTRLEDGMLAAVDNQISTSTGMVKLRARFANADGALFPNEFVNVHLLVNTLRGATLVPAVAVQSGAPGSYVYVVQPDAKVKVQVVTTGPTDGTNIVITKGILPGAEVVTDGIDRLSDGMKVQIVQPPAMPAAGGAATQHHRQGAAGAGP